MEISSLIKSFEKELSRELQEKEKEFLEWLYEQHRNEQKLKAQ